MTMRRPEIEETERIDFEDFVAELDDLGFGYLVTGVIARLLEERGLNGTGEYLSACLKGAQDWYTEELRRPLYEPWTAAVVMGELPAADFEEVFRASVARIIREQGTEKGAALVREVLKGSIEADNFGRAYFDTGE